MSTNVIAQESARRTIVSPIRRTAAAFMIAAGLSLAVAGTAGATPSAPGHGSTTANCHISLICSDIR